MYLALTALVRARQAHAALAAHAPRTLLDDAPAGVLALARGERFRALMNFSASEQHYTLAGRWTDCISGSILGGTITLAPYALHWLERGDE